MNRKCESAIAQQSPELPPEIKNMAEMHMRKENRDRNYTISIEISMPM